MPSSYLLPSPSSLIHQSSLQHLSTPRHFRFSVVGIHSAQQKRTRQKPSLSCSIRHRTNNIGGTPQSCLTAEEVRHPESDATRRRSSRVQVQYLAEQIRTVPKQGRVEFLDVLLTQQDRRFGADRSFHLNNLLMALVLADEPDLALSTLSGVSAEGLLVPDSWTYSTMMRCYCKKGQLDEAEGVLDRMVADGLSPTVATVTQLINSYCRRGGLKGAFRVFDTMRNSGISPNVQTYNCLIKGLCYVGRVEKALDMLKGIKDGPVKPDVYTYTAVMDGFCKVGRSDEARELLHEAVQVGLSPTVVTYNTLFDGYCREGRPGRGLGVLRKMKERNCSPDRVSYQTLIHGLLKWGKARAALGVYREMEVCGFEVDERMMNLLVRGLCRTSTLKESNATDLLDDACRLLGKMQSSGLAVEYGTYVLVISSCSVGKKSEDALMTVQRMMAAGFRPSVIDLEGAVKGLCREGKLEKALFILALIEEDRRYPRTAAYNILIKEMNMQGMVLSACNVYGIALKRGVVPEKKPRLGVKVRSLR